MRFPFCGLVLVIAPACASPTLANPGGNPTAGCTPTIVGQPTVVVSGVARQADSARVLPAGVVGPTGFDFSDTPMGVVKSQDGSHYLFFGSDGSCHANCNLPGERDGSITRTVGTLDNPLGTDPPMETVLPLNTANLPAYMVYAGGGPTYRVPAGQPGAGNLLLIYQAARLSFPPGYQYPDCDANGQNCGQHANGFYSNFGLARSADDGLTWTDLGLIVSPGTPYNPQQTVDMGVGNLVATGSYFYIYFPDVIDNGTVATGMSVARVSYPDLLTAASNGTPLPSFEKYNDGQWNQPGLGGTSSSVLPNGPYFGDMNVAWDSATKQFIAIQANAVISITESSDGVNWSPSTILVNQPPATDNYEYMTLTGTGGDPSILGRSFYLYFTDYRGWITASIDRVTVSCGGLPQG